MSGNNDLSGKDIQGYKIVKAIGQGKFSIVYKAETSTNNIVALKKIKIFDIMDPKQREKCLKEVKLMQPMDHPNIIKYIDSFIFDNELIIISEWAEKGDLKRLIKNAIQEDTPFEEIKIWDYSLQISSALKYMHEKRIMHRDLKPANIFISGDGTLKIGDLGLGRVFSSETIEAYSKVGTPLYMSPELLHGEGYDMKSDVWSLGCVLYELCELKSPFRDENEKMSLMELFTKITKGEFKSMSNKYSEELRNFINSMIVVNPANRCDMMMAAKVSEEMFLQLKKTPKIDSILVMEDIYEKLCILEYHKYFCLVLGLKPISKHYFALKNDQNQFEYFILLCYWIMNLSKINKTNAAKAPNIIENSKSKKSPEEISTKLIIDIKNSGIRTVEQLKPAYLIAGYGDSVCFLINDLLNRELIRLNYKFESPDFSEFKTKDEESYQIQEENPDLNDYEIEGYGKQNNKKMNETVSRFTSATTRASEEENNNQKKTEENEINKNILKAQIDEKQWKVECIRINSVLDEYEGNQIYNEKNEDYHKHFFEIHKFSHRMKKNIVEIEKINFYDFCDKLECDLVVLNYGEKILNLHCEKNRENLQNSFQTQKTMFNDLKSKTNFIHEKIGIHEDICKHILEIKEKIKQRERLLNNENDEFNDLRKRKNGLMNEIKQLDISIGLIDSQLIHKKKIYKNYDNKINQSPTSSISSL